VTARFKAYFLRGLAALLPTVLTIWICVWGYRVIQKYIGAYVTAGIRSLILSAGASTAELEKFWVDKALDVAGFVIALVAVCILAVLLATVAGRALWRVIENFIMNTPVLRRIYPYIKQVTDFLLAQESQQKFLKRVVAVEYPRKGIWSLGFVTGSGIRKVGETTGEAMLAVLIPTSPTPFTGFVIMVPESSTIPLDVTIEEALRFTVSGGVVTPAATRASVEPGANLQQQKQEKVEVTKC